VPHEQPAFAAHAHAFEIGNLNFQNREKEYRAARHVRSEQLLAAAAARACEGAADNHNGAECTNMTCLIVFLNITQ
jgi:hypothetical protein